MRLLPPTLQNIRAAVRILREGGTVAHATETCYGLACDLKNQDAVRRLFKMKTRPDHLSVSALFWSIEQAKLFVEWNDLAEQLAEHLPGPLTIVLSLRQESGLFPTPSGNLTLGVRISSHPVAMRLVEAFGSPISTTSANVHGKPSTYSPEEIVEQFGKMEIKPDLILDSGVLERRLSSSVVSTVGGSLEILRAGPLNL